MMIMKTEFCTIYVLCSFKLSEYFPLNDIRPIFCKKSNIIYGDILFMKSINSLTKIVANSIL